MHCLATILFAFYFGIGFGILALCLLEGGYANFLKRAPGLEDWSPWKNINKIRGKLAFVLACIIFAAIAPVAIGYETLRDKW